MFTGIIEEIGTVSDIRRSGQGYHLTVHAKTVLDGTHHGDSIAVNGTCLTVTHLSPDTFTVGLSPETRQKTNLMYLQRGHRVHLERALTPSSRLGGHFVQGHVDEVGTITHFRREGDALWVTVRAAPGVMRYIVQKGFIALDGVSLTVTEVSETDFSVSLVAYTQEHITLPRQDVGYSVNIEVDVLSKYVERFISQPAEHSNDISLDFLARHGYM